MKIPRAYNHNETSCATHTPLVTFNSHETYKETSLLNFFVMIVELN